MLATIVGLAVAVWTVGAADFANVVHTAGRLGAGGFLAYCAWSLGIYGLLGTAWLAAAPGEPGARLSLFTWARLVREGVADLLPFSHLGGLIVSARVLASAGIPARRVYGSLVVDMTTEMAGQVVFTLFGLAQMTSILIGNHAAVALRPAILGGTGVMIALMLAFFGAQQRALDLAAVIAARFLPNSTGMLAEIRGELRAIYARRDHVLLAFGFNLLAWIASGIGGWIALRLMGVSMSIWYVLSLESLIFTLRSVAFMIPGALGVQEVAYALAGPLFGLPAETALALSLAKRAREIALGAPTLLLWQMNEMRAITAKPR